MTNIHNVINIENVTNIYNVTNIHNVIHIENVTRIDNVINIDNLTNIHNVIHIENVTSIHNVTYIENVTRIDNVINIDNLSNIHTVTNIHTNNHNVTNNHTVTTNHTVTNIDTVIYVLQRTVLTIQEEAGVCAPQLVDSHAGVVTVVGLGDVKKGQLGQRVAGLDLHALQAVEDPEPQNQTLHSNQSEQQQSLMTLANIQQIFSGTLMQLAVGRILSFNGIYS